MRFIYGKQLLQFTMLIKIVILLGGT